MRSFCSCVSFPEFEETLDEAGEVAGNAFALSFAVGVGESFCMIVHCFCDDVALGIRPAIKVFEMGGRLFHEDPCCPLHRLYSLRSTR